MSLKTHTVYNLLGSFVPMVISLVTVPLYLRVIGLERYGVMSLFWVLLGYFGLFDLGLGRAVSQRLASLRDGSDAERNRIFWAGLILSLGLAVAGTLLLIPIARFGIRFLDVAASDAAREINAAVPLLVIALPVTLLAGITSGALVGRERFGQVNLIDGLSNIFLVVAPLVVAMTLGPSLPYLLATALLVRLAGALLMLGACRSAVPLARPVFPTLATVRPLLGYGGWMTVETAVGYVIAMFDRFVIGAVLGAAAVSTYVIPSNVVQRLVLVPISFAKAQFPRLAHVSEAQGQAMLVDGIYGLAVLLTPATIGLIAIAEPALILWIGPALGSASAPLAEILLPAIYANGFGYLYLNHLLARDRPAVVAKLHLAEFLPYFGFLYLMLQVAGLEGAAIAWSVRTVLDAVALAWLSGTGLGSLRRLWPQFALVVLSMAVALWLPFTSILAWAAQAAILIIATVQAYLVAPPQAKQLILRRLGPVKAFLAK